MGLLRSSGVITLQKLLEVLGPALRNVQTEFCAGHPLRTLVPEEPGALEAGALGRREESSSERWSREARPDLMDTFPDLQLNPAPRQLCRLQQGFCGQGKMSFHRATGQNIYSTCTKVAHTRDLSQHPPHSVDCQAGGGAASAVEDPLKTCTEEKD